MAKVQGPLMSMGASGTIGKSITFGTWKGIKTARQRVVPANPKTVAQVAQRSIMKTVVGFWRVSLTQTDGKTSWNRFAATTGKPQSGFNAYTSVAAKISKELPSAGMVIGCTNHYNGGIAMEVCRLDNGIIADEEGNYRLTVGPSLNQMLDVYDESAAMGAVSFDISAKYSAGDIIFCQVSKDAGGIADAKRSGVYNF